MTALLSLEHLNLDRVLVEAPYSPGPAESLAGFGAGERITVRDELRALLIVSANDAANTLALRVGGTKAKFVAMMNARARQLGLTHTHYDNAVGLDGPGNYSSPADLVKLTLFLRQNAFFRQVTDTKRITITSGAHPRALTNRNTTLFDLSSMNGVKTGHTNAAGYILVGSATRDGVTVVSAVLGTPSEAARDADTLALVKYGLALYHRITVVKQGRVFASVPLQYRDRQRVSLLAKTTVQRTAKRTEHLTTQVVGLPTQVNGPLAQGARLATLVVRQRGKVVARVPLVTAVAVSHADAPQQLGDVLGRPLTLIALGILVVGSLLLVLIRRRSTRRRTRRERSRHRETEIAT